MNIHEQQQRMTEQQDAIEASVRALNEASNRLTRGLRADAELVTAIANLTQAVSMLVVEPAHRRIEEGLHFEAIDVEHFLEGDDA